jgi:NTE family protein
MAHVGIIRELETIGIRPDIICGSSVGSLIGAACILGKMQELCSWVEALSKSDIVRYMDIRLAAGGGFAHGHRLMEHLSASLGNPLIENVRPRFVAVATDLHSGREIWLRDGPIWSAVRASIALPGMFTPVAKDDLWLVDGGLVNPVPVSVCRAMGADIIIAVNLNGDRLGRLTRGQQKPLVSSNAEQNEGSEPLAATPQNAEAAFLERMSTNIKGRTQPLFEQWLNRGRSLPGIFDVMAASINIMQDRITRARLAGEPADVILSPRLSALGLLDLDQAGEAIQEGHRCVRRNIDQLEMIL